MGDMTDTEREMDKGRAPIVSIDGTKAKRIRETKKLTQLYVASVVGVTTDTISRWENNRYPTIRRDNAEKLASALEVDLSEILKEEEEQLSAQGGKPPKKGKKFVIAGASVAIIVIALVALLPYALEKRPSALRWLPKFASPGEIIPVELTISRNEAETKGLIVKEKLPRGWRLVKSNPAPAAGTDGEEVKWLLSGEARTILIRYTVQAPPEATFQQPGAFEGITIAYNGDAGRAEKTTGNAAVTINPYHWADANGDNRIDDSEIMPAYYLTEEMKGLGLEWPEIEAIWSGKGYRWEKGKRGFIVNR